MLDSPLSRRAFLRRGVWGGLLLSIGGASWLGSRHGSDAPLPPTGLKVLTPEQYATVYALAERIVPILDGERRPSELNVAGQIDELLTQADPSVQRELKQLLGLFQNALVGFVFEGTRRPFTELAPEQQDRVLESWQHSALSLRRAGFQALRSLVVATYYGSSSTWKALGYAGQGLGQQGR